MLGVDNKIEKQFKSLMPSSIPKYPGGGHAYIFEWLKKEDKEKWKNDAYIWGKTRYNKKLSSNISKICFYVRTILLN